MRMSAMPTTVAELRETLAVAKAAVITLYAGQRAADEADQDDSTSKLSACYRDADPFDGSWLPPRGFPAQLPPDMPSLVTDFVSCDSVQEGGLTFAESLLIKFVVMRKGDAASAADRFLHCRKMVIENELTFVVDDDVRAAASVGFMHVFPPSEATKNHPLIVVLPRRLDWSKITVKQAKKLWFCVVMLVANMSIEAQRSGVAVTNSMKDVGFANICMEFQKFLLTAVHKCVPFRVASGFIANQPFLFGSIVYPVMQNLLSEKLRSRMHVIGSKYHKAEAYFGTNEMLLVEMGGRLDVDNDKAVKAMMSSLCC